MNYKKCEIALNIYEHTFLVKMYVNKTRKFIYNFLPQNVLIPHNYILPTYTFITLINIEYISFFSSSDMHESRHLFGCHTTGINSSLNSSLSPLCFSKFNILEKKAILTREKNKIICLRKKVVLTRVKIKTISLTENLFLTVIKITGFYINSNI